MRVLILSAPVGAGHDAAARAVKQQLEERGATVEVDDGLALLGLSRIVVDGYHFQILHAAWSWRLLYRLTKSRALIRLAGALQARLASRRLVDRITEADPDVIVSAYPIVSMALAGLRRRARLPWPCATLVTDFDPHPAWVHCDVDANLVVGEPGRARQAVSPPIAAVHPDPDARQRVRAELGITTGARVALIVGGAWGVGNLRGAAHAIAAVPGAHAIVVTGRNQRLYRALEHDDAVGCATILGFTHRMPELMAASDVLIQNAGGLTCLEAFGIGLPVIMFDPLPGHGEDNSKLMHRAGLVAAAADAPSLATMLASDEYWTTLAPAQVAQARALFDRESTGVAITRLTAKAVAQPSHVRRLAPLVAVSFALGAWFIGENPPAGYAANTRIPPASPSRPTSATPITCRN